MENANVPPNCLWAIRVCIIHEKLHYSVNSIIRRMSQTGAAVLEPERRCFIPCIILVCNLAQQSSDDLTLGIDRLHLLSVSYWYDFILISVNVFAVCPEVFLRAHSRLCSFPLRFCRVQTRIIAVPEAREAYGKYPCDRHRDRSELELMFGDAVDFSLCDKVRSNTAQQ